MLEADKRAVIAETRQMILEIRERQLNFFTDNLNSLGVQSAVIGGFSIIGNYSRLKNIMTLFKSL